MATSVKQHSRVSNADLYPSKAALEAAFKVARTAKIPQMPDVVLALRAEIKRPEPDLAVAANLIAQDLAITGQLLKTVNSPAFSLRTKISNVQQAAALMGLERLNNLVTTAAINQMLKAKHGPVRVIWDAVMEEARIMSAIAQVVPEINEDEAYLFGIMHDVGCLIFASLSPDYGTMWSLHSNSAPQTLLDYERSTLGTTHTTLGFLLAGHWQLPSFISLAICHHHIPGRLSTEDPKVGQLIALAKLAHYLGALSNGTGDMQEMLNYRDDAWQELDIAEADWTALCDQAAEGNWSE